MNTEYCPECDVYDFVVYGYCTNCGKKHYPPLMEIKNDMGDFISEEEWKEYPEYLTYEQLKGIKNGTINFIAKGCKS